MNDETRQPGSGPDRRGFVARLAALVLGAVAGLVPGVAGLLVVLDPLRRKGAAGGAVLVTTLQSLPSDGVPRKFSVVMDRVDAWNTYRQIPVGAVYLKRTGEQTVVAFNVACPHAGCFVSYAAERRQFLCPCHNSSFGVDGAIDDPKSPSPRGLDALEVEIRQGSEVWVHFQNFQPGHKERLPVV